MHTTIPSLDLGPKLGRPLQPWNPLDYLRLLYWILFFPQALHVYLGTLANPRWRETAGAPLPVALSQDPLQRNLVQQAIPLAVLTPAIVAGGLRLLGVPVDWFGVVASVALGVAYGVIRGRSFGTATGVALGVTFSTVFGVTTSVAFGAMGAVAPAALESQIGDVTVGLIGGAVLGVGLGIVSSTAIGLTGGVVFGAAGAATRYLTNGVAGSIVLSAALGPSFGVAFGLAFCVTVCATLLRPADYILLGLPSAKAWPGGPWRLSRVVVAPLGPVQGRLEEWLEQDWAAGLENASQLLAYTLQFIPVVRAINSVLDRLPRERLLAAVAALAREPFDWDLVRFCSASLRDGMWNEAIERLFIVPGRFRRSWQERFSLEPRLDTPSRAACAGFWYLHEGDPARAADAFQTVSRLPGGEELFLSASCLAAALRVDAIGAIARWLEASARLAHLPGPHLRPGALHTLERLRAVAAEAEKALGAHAPAVRHPALDRATAALSQLLADIQKSCPQPEAAIIKTAAGRWREILASARWGEWPRDASPADGAGQKA